MAVQPNPTPQAKPSNESPLLAGIIVGIVLAVLWALLVWVTHNGVPLAAWGIGGLIGVTLAKSSRKPDASLGLLAGGLTLGTVVLAKALIVVLALPQMSRDEILRNRQATTAMFMVEMTSQRSYSPELQAAIDSQVHSDSQVPDGSDTLSSRGSLLSYRMMREARARAESAGPAERERVVRTNTDSLLAHRGFLGLLGGMFGLWDLTWLGLGMSTAWKLAIAGWI
jgi:predicted lipid-binding transport protein (Tim44 family)